MKRIRASLVRLVGTFFPSGRDRDLAEELDSHLQLHIDDNIRAGMSPGEARRQALLKFGAMEAVKEDHRDRRGYPLLSHVLQDLRFAGRLLRKAPASASPRSSRWRSPSASTRRSSPCSTPRRCRRCPSPKGIAS